MRRTNKLFLFLVALVLVAQGVAATPQLVQYYDTGDDQSAYIDGLESGRAAGAQYIVANFSDTIRQIGFLTGASGGTPGTYTVKIMTNSSANYPQVNASTFCTITTVNASGWNTCYNSTGYTVTSGQKFFVTIWANSANGANFITWRYKNGGLGAGKWFSWKAGTWTSYEGYSFMWRLYNDTVAPPVYSNNTYTVNVNDLFDDSDVTDANVTFYNASGVLYSALTDGSGNAVYMRNATGGPTSVNFNVTKTAFFGNYEGTVGANTTVQANLSQSVWTNLTVTSVVTNATVAMPVTLVLQGGKSYALTGAATNIYLRAGTMNFTWIKTGWNNLSFSQNIVAGTNGTGNASGAFSNRYTVTAQNTTGAAITNATVMTVTLASPAFTTACTTTNGSCYFQLLQEYNYSITVEPAGYEYKDYNLTPTGINNTLLTSHYTKNSITFRFVDEETYALINGSTVYFELISDTYSNNYTTTTGTAYVDLLTPETYYIRYVAAGYAYRFYTLTLEDNYHYALNLTLLNATQATNVTITVKDNLGNIVVGAVVKILKYDVVTNSYLINQVIETNFEGQVVAGVMLNQEYYEFIVEYEGAQVYMTAPTYIYSPTFTLYIPLNTAGFEGYFTSQQLSGSLTHSNATKLVTYVWNDENNVASQGCVYAYLYPAMTLYNSSCIASSSGSTTMYLTNTSDTTYLVKGYVTVAGEDYIVASTTVTYNASASTGANGAFLGVILVVVFIFIGFWSLTLAVILGSIAPFLYTITGLWAVPAAFTLPLMVGGLVVAYMIGGRRQ